MNHRIVPRNTLLHRISIALPVSLILLGSADSVFATSGTEIKTLSEKTVETGIASQKNHETWVEEEHRLREQIEDLENRLEHITWQRQKLAIYQKGLQEKITGLEQKAAAMEAVNMKLLPVLEKNLDRLQEGLDRDLPVNLEERKKSMLHARQVLNDYDMGLLDKTRAVLDAVAREVDLGHRVEVFEDEIEVNGSALRVKMLLVGRTGLYAITLDSSSAYRWDRKLSNWNPLQTDLTNLHEAVETAEGTRLVGLSKLPVETPVAITGEEQK